MFAADEARGIAPLLARRAWLPCIALLGTLALSEGWAQATADISIRPAHDSASEQQTREQLQRLLATYDLTRWTFTHAVVIDETEIPHSHPVLTLHTRHRKDDELLLSTYVHEQMHWLVAAHPREAGKAISELKALYPKIPVGYPEGSSDEAGNYEHLLVIYLEYRADQTLLGELKARQVMAFWATDHYTWLYRSVLDHPGEVGRIVALYKLDAAGP